jgi:hypothetical protein
LLNFSVSDQIPFSFDALDEQCLDIYNTAATLISSLTDATAAATTAGQQQQQQQQYERTEANERAYIAFPTVYLHYGEEENNGILDTRFAFSRNGSTFRYIDGDRRAYVPRGIGAPVSLDAEGLQPSLFNLSVAFFVC